MAQPQWLLVGLGNPGPEYAAHRHNIGFMAVDAIAHRHGFSTWRERFNGLVAEGRLGDAPVMALKPMTFMNESGRAVGIAARFYKLSCAKLIVFHDELDLAAGKVRVKKGGGAAGHNGLRSIDAHLGRDYWRVRLGIGHPGDKDRVLGHVLNSFAAGERDWLDPLLASVADRAPLLLADDPAEFMSRVALDTQPARPAKSTRHGNDGDGERTGGV
jgi:peptidyl-tRNA hydrolase